MAKIDEASLTPDATASSRGRVVIHRTKNGAVAQKWPKPRGKWNTPADFYRQQEFGQVARGVASPQPAMLRTAINYARGSDQVARDILMMAAYGTLYEINHLDGTPVEYYRVVAPNAQLILDQVTDTPGAMLYRSPLGWLEIPPGSDGELLGITGQTPQWVPTFVPTPPNPAGPNLRPFFRNTTIYLTNATVGGTSLSTIALVANTQYLLPITLPNDRTVTELAISVSGAIALSSVKLALYLNDPTDGGPSTLIHGSGNIATTTTGLKTEALTEPLVAGQYWIALWPSHAITVRATSQTFTFSQLGYALGAATPHSVPYVSRTEAYANPWPDLSAATFNLNSAATPIPLVGCR